MEYLIFNFRVPDHSLRTFINDYLNVWPGGEWLGVRRPGEGEHPLHLDRRQEVQLPRLRQRRFTAGYREWFVPPLECAINCISGGVICSQPLTNLLTQWARPHIHIAVFKPNVSAKSQTAYNSALPLWKMPNNQQVVSSKKILKTARKWRSL